MSNIRTVNKRHKRAIAAAIVRNRPAETPATQSAAAETSAPAPAAT